MPFAVRLHRSPDVAPTPAELIRESGKMEALMLLLNEVCAWNGVEPPNYAQTE